MKTSTGKTSLGKSGPRLWLDLGIFAGGRPKLVGYLHPPRLISLLRFEDLPMESIKNQPDASLSLPSTLTILQLPLLSLLMKLSQSCVARRLPKSRGPLVNQLAGHSLLTSTRSSTRIRATG